jgi:hypothetical protein
MDGVAAAAAAVGWGVLGMVYVVGHWIFGADVAVMGIVDTHVPCLVSSGSLLVRFGGRAQCSAMRVSSSPCCLFFVMGGVAVFALPPKALCFFLALSFHCALIQKGKGKKLLSGLPQVRSTLLNWTVCHLCGGFFFDFFGWTGELTVSGDDEMMDKRCFMMNSSSGNSSSEKDRRERGGEERRSAGN